MHTGTNVWRDIKGCEDSAAKPTSAECLKAIGTPWKHVPLAYRTISPSASCTVYATQRNCTDYVKRMTTVGLGLGSYELLVTNATVRGFRPSSRGNLIARANPGFASHLRMHPIPLMQMCNEQKQRAIDLEKQGLLTVLHFDDIRKQANRPTKDAREHVWGDVRKSVARNARKQKRKSLAARRLRNAREAKRKSLAAAEAAR